MFFLTRQQPDSASFVETTHLCPVPTRHAACSDVCSAASLVAAWQERGEERQRSGSRCAPPSRSASLASAYRATASPRTKAQVSIDSLG